MSTIIVPFQLLASLLTFLRNSTLHARIISSSSSSHPQLSTGNQSTHKSSPVGEIELVENEFPECFPHRVIQIEKAEKIKLMKSNQLLRSIKTNRRPFPTLINMETLCNPIPFPILLSFLTHSSSPSFTDSLADPVYFLLYEPLAKNWPTSRN